MALTRSENMARIRAKNTRPEKLLRSALWKKGLRYRIHSKTPVGRPDVVFPDPMVAVFIDGCFWHGCADHYVRPRTKIEFWATKLKTNVLRDCRQTLELEALGWKVVRIWEHEVFEGLSSVVERIERAAKEDGYRKRPSWRVIKVEVLDEDKDIERRHLISLRNPDSVRVTEGKRSTKKWKRPGK